MTWLDLAHLYVVVASLAVGPVLGVVLYAVAVIGAPR